MAKTAARRDEDLELNMTPMIDVVFNLVIFFMIVTDMTQRELEELVLPWSNSAIEDKNEETERRVIINVSKHVWSQKDPRPAWTPKNMNVDIKIKGIQYNLERLKEEMFKHAETKRDLTDPNTPSEVFVLIRCDKDIRWREVQWVMQVCADPAVRIYKLQFATSKPHEAPGAGGS